MFFFGSTISCRREYRKLQKYLLFTSNLSQIFEGNRKNFTNQRGQLFISRLIGTNYVSDDRSAKRTVATTFPTPLLQGTFVTHTHMSTHVQNGVDGIFVADSALGASSKSCTSSFDPRLRRCIRCGRCNGL